MVTAGFLWCISLPVLQLVVQDSFLRLYPGIYPTVKPSHCGLVLGVPISLGCYKAVRSQESLIAKAHGMDIFVCLLKSMKPQMFPLESQDTAPPALWASAFPVS